MEKYQETFEKWADLNRQLYSECLEYMKSALEKNGGRIDIESENPPCVTYDGGNHPEYASNCYSLVYAVFMKNGEVYLDTEDSSEYPADAITSNELYYVAESLKEMIEL